MPKPWERSEHQEKYLDALLPRFAQARLDNRIARFKTDLYEGWFERWPEEVAVFGNGWNKGDSMSPDDVCRLGAAIKKRKEQLYNYIRWHAGGKVVRSRVSSGILKDFISKSKKTAKRSRKRQRLELYSRKYYETRFKAQVDQEVSDTKPPDESKEEYQKRKMSIYCKWRLLSWEAESNEVKAEVETLWNSMNNAANDGSGDDEDGKLDSNEAEDPGVEGYGGCLDELGEIVTSFLRELQDHTGWAFSIFGGGLNREGEVKVVSSHVGATAMGTTFPQVCNDYKKNVLREFFTFIKVQHPVEERLLVQVNNKRTPSPDNDGDASQGAADKSDETDQELSESSGATAVDTSKENQGHPTKKSELCKKAGDSEHGNTVSNVMTGIATPAPSLCPTPPDVLSHDTSLNLATLSSTGAHINVAPDLISTGDFRSPPFSRPDPFTPAASTLSFEYPTASSQSLLSPPDLNWISDASSLLPMPMEQSLPYGNLSPMSSFLAMMASNDEAYNGATCTDPSSLILFNSTNVATTTLSTCPTNLRLPNNDYVGQGSALLGADSIPRSFVPTIPPAMNKAIGTCVQRADRLSGSENRAPPGSTTESGVNNRVLVKPRKRSRKDEVDTSFVLPEGTTRAHKPRQMADDTHWEGPVLKRSRHR